MGKETCTDCHVKLAQPVSFCPSCERPTRHATDSERLEWDLKQWRRHVDRSVAAGMNPSGTAVGFGGSVAVAPQRQPQPHEQPQVRQDPAPAVRPRIVPMPAPQSRFTRLRRTAAPAEARVETPVAPKPAPAPKKRRFAREKKARLEPAPVVERDRDHEFAYDCCATCSETDWIVRYSRNEDETWNYWCVRCSRAFKTEVRLRHALKPILSSGVVVGGLAAASLLLFR